MDTTSLRPEDARLLLSEVERARRATRFRIGEHSWISFAIWAAVFAGAAIAGPRALWYWVAAVPVAMALTAISDVRLSGARLARRSDWRYWAIGSAIGIASFGGGAVFSHGFRRLDLFVLDGIAGCLARPPSPGGPGPGGPRRPGPRALALPVEPEALYRGLGDVGHRDRRQRMVDEAMTARSGHPILQLDEVVHQRVRLGILAVLAEAEKVDFTHLRTCSASPTGTSAGICLSSTRRGTSRPTRPSKDGGPGLG